MPDTFDEACEMLATSGDRRPIPIAGGTDLLVHWPTRLDDHKRMYLDLSKLSELRSIKVTDDYIELGALTTYFDVLMDSTASAEFPLLITAARQIGAIQIQTRGTWAGNIVNASPAADGVPVLMAYDAEVVLASASGSRTVPLSGLYSGYKTLDRREDELVAAIRIPRRMYDFQVFEKVGARRAQAITKLGVAITRCSSKDADSWCVVANSMAPTVCRCRTVEAMLNNRTDVSGPSSFHLAIAQDVTPIDDIRSTAEYRRHVFARVIYHAVRDVCEWIQ